MTNRYINKLLGAGICSFALFSFGFVLMSEARAAFWDETLINGAVRTEYRSTGLDTNFGTSADPVVFDFCPWAQGCPEVYDQANAYGDNGGTSASNYWVVIMNNEYYIHSGTTNTGGNTVNGPPDAGLPIYLPSRGVNDGDPNDDGVVGLNVSPANRTARLSLDHWTSDNPHPSGDDAIPFLAFGAFEDRGNGQAILLMNNDPNYIRSVVFDLNIEAARQGGSDGVTWMAIQAFSEWGGTKRAFYLTLYSKGISPEGEPPQLIDFENKAPYDSDGLWNWPIEASVYFPGAQFYAVDATWASNNCSGLSGLSRYPDGSLGTWKTYIIEIEKVFRCVWPSMPTSADLSSFSWIAEIFGEGSRMQFVIRAPETSVEYIGS